MHAWSCRSSSSFDDDNDGSERAFLDEEMFDKVEAAEVEEMPTFPAPTNSDLNTSHLGGSKDAVDDLSCESTPSPLVSQNLHFIGK